MADNLNPCDVLPNYTPDKIDYRTFKLPSSALNRAIVPDGSVPDESTQPLIPSFSINDSKYTHCAHMSNALPRRAADNTIRAAMSLILSKNIQFDTFAFRGMSGAIFAPVLAYLMNKEMIMVRKNKGSGCASGRWVEGFKHAQRYILVDDLICSGNSAVDTILAVQAFTGNKGKLAAVLLYDNQVELLTVGDSFGCVSVERLLERAQEKFVAGEHTSASW